MALIYKLNTTVDAANGGPASVRDGAAGSALAPSGALIPLPGRDIGIAYRSHQDQVQRISLSALGVRSILDAGLTLIGSIDSKSSLAIKGVLTGDVTVHGADGLVVVFPGASVRGKIRARFIWLMGDTEGRIECQRLLLLPGGRFTGESVCETLEVKHGAEYLPTLAQKTPFDFTSQGG